MVKSINSLGRWAEGNRKSYREGEMFYPGFEGYEETCEEDKADIATVGQTSGVRHVL